MTSSGVAKEQPRFYCYYHSKISSLSDVILRSFDVVDVLIGDPTGKMVLIGFR